ncbi:MAG: TIGR04283 family arsenosugar biosynthesis glycosyltransferase [Ginsengibacter sp.]
MKVLSKIFMAHFRLAAGCLRYVCGRFMISIIIPTFNEAKKIAATIESLLNKNDKKNIEEIIIADGGSIDNTVEIATDLNAKSIIVTGKNRAAQLNAAAHIAKGSILLFLHADSFAPTGYTVKIIEAINHNYQSGCFRLRFDHNHWFLKANAWFTKFDVNAIRFGDQGLFVTKDVFKKSGGYDENLFIMEDQEIIHRLKKYSSFKVLNAYITTSSRKYLANGIYKTQGTFFIIWLCYYLGISQQRLLKLYRKLSR